MSSRAECTVMFRRLIAIWVLVGTMLVPALTRAAGPLELKSVRVDLPDEERMFTGPGADAINNNCLACHSAGMVLDQPALSRETWTAEVNKMITPYKAPLAPLHVPAIIDYLTRLPTGKQAKRHASRTAACHPRPDISTQQPH